jgi:hypothetical protein
LCRRAIASAVTRDPEAIVRGRKRVRADAALAAAAPDDASSALEPGSEAGEMPSSLTDAEKAFIRHQVMHTVSVIRAY